MTLGVGMSGLKTHMADYDQDEQDPMAIQYSNTAPNSAFLDQTYHLKISKNAKFDFSKIKQL